MWPTRSEECLASGGPKESCIFWKPSKWFLVSRGRLQNYADKRQTRTARTKVKIAVTVDPEIPVPPQYYGGIERVVDLVVRGLVDRGHTLTLFANGSSSVPCRLIPLPGRFSRPISDCVRNTWAIDTEIAREGFDIIHSFGRLAYLWPSLMRGKRVVMTYQRSVTPRSVKLGLVLSRNKVRFTAVGKHLVKNLKGEWSIIPNGVDTDQFSYNPSTTSDAPLTFLGRIEYIKGAHLAVEVAKQSCRKLIIMGNVEPRHKDYFDERIRPHIDSENVVFTRSSLRTTSGSGVSDSLNLLSPSDNATISGLSPGS